MLKLTIAISDVKPLASANVANSKLAVWREQDGTVCAYGYTVNRRYWMHFPHLASYCFTLGSEEVTAFLQPSTQLEAVWDTYYRSVLPIALQVLGREALHASAIQTSRGAVAFCAISETGKSTIAYGLSQRGYSLWGDDAVVFEHSESGILTTPLPFAVRLRLASAQYFHNFQGSSRGLIGHHLVIPTNFEPIRLAAVCILERSLVTECLEPVEVRRIRSVSAFSAILTHAYCFNLEDVEQKQKMVRNYASLVANVPVFIIRFSVGFDQLPRLLDEIEQQVIDETADLNSNG